MVEMLQIQLLSFRLAFAILLCLHSCLISPIFRTMLLLAVLLTSSLLSPIFVLGGLTGVVVYLGWMHRLYRKEHRHYYVHTH
jgi:hypothetical protein